MFTLNDKLILITGASSGIGRKTAEVLSLQGARLILVGRNETELANTLKLLPDNNHVVRPFDLNAVDEIPAWLRHMVTDLGRPISGVVHSAGVHSTTPIRMINSENVCEVLRVNLLAGLSLLKGFAAKRIHEPNGSFVFLSSVMGLVGQPGVISYSASKGAISAAVKSAALELAKFGLRVNSVCPGVIQTEMWDQYAKSVPKEQVEVIKAKHPLGLGKPEDVASAICFLLSDASRWITGTNLIVDGGYTCQ